MYPSPNPRPYSMDDMDEKEDEGAWFCALELDAEEVMSEPREREWSSWSMLLSSRRRSRSISEGGIGAASMFGTNGDRGQGRWIVRVSTAELYAVDLDAGW